MNGETGHIETWPFEPNTDDSPLYLDGADRPHVGDDDWDSGVFHHLRLDGGTWRDDAVSIEPCGWTMTYRLTTAGDLVTLRKGYREYCILAHRGDTWSGASFDLRPDTFSFDPIGLAVDADGTAFVLGSLIPDGLPSSCALAVLPPGQTRTAPEVIPGTGVDCVGGYRAALLGARSGRAAIAYVSEDGSEWLYREHGPEGWDPPEVITARASSGLSPSGWLDPQRDQAAVVLESGIFVRSAPGSWRRVVLGRGGIDVRSAGFAADGRMWILVGSRDSGASILYALYEEL